MTTDRDVLTSTRASIAAAVTAAQTDLTDAVSRLTSVATAAGITGVPTLQSDIADALAKVTALTTTVAMIDAQLATPVTPTTPATESTDGTSIVPGSGTITAANGDAWTLAGSLLIQKNGAGAYQGWQAYQLVYHNHTVFMLGIDHASWYSWTGSAFVQASNPTVIVGPVPTGPAFYVAPNGNDSAAGSLTAPFATLAQAQRAARNSPSKSDTIYLRAGVYSFGGLTFTVADQGQTWSYYPPDGVNTALLDGGGSVASAFNTLAGQGALNITIIGIKIQHYTTWAIVGANGSGHVTVTQCDIGNSGLVGGGVGSSSLIACADHWTVTNNYLHDCPSAGVSFWAFNSGDSCDGTVISNNVVLRCCTGLSDSGAIYGGMRNTNVKGGSVTISNNYVANYGSNGLAVRAIYLDDDASNCTITGNVLAPPVAGVSGLSSIIINNGGCANLYQNNIIDLGSSNTIPVSVDGPGGAGGSITFGNPTSPTKITGNIILSNFSAQNCGVKSFDESGHIYNQNPGITSAWLQISGNVYFNTGGGNTDSSGNVVSDSSPQHLDPQISGNTYTIASGSPVFKSPVKFTPIVGGWGPPGFVIS